MISQEIFIKPVLVFGCGNVLFGDDGFGPTVVDYLVGNYTLSDSVFAVNAGTSIRDFLFDILLSPDKPLEIYIVDAVSLPDRRGGEIFELELDKIPLLKTSNFSLHQFPTVNLLCEMNNLTSVRVRVLAVQAEYIPDFVKPGLSPEVRKAVEPACIWLLHQFGKTEGGDLKDKDQKQKE